MSNEELIKAEAERKVKKLAMNIVNQILDMSGASVEKRQAINDQCDDFVVGILATFALSLQHSTGEQWVEYNIMDKTCPEAGREYLVINKLGIITVDRWEDCWEWVNQTINDAPITHYMPLPSPPTH